MIDNFPQRVGSLVVVIRIGIIQDIVGKDFESFLPLYGYGNQQKRRNKNKPDFFHGAKVCPYSGTFRMEEMKR
jgi:hypothetical protein